MKRVAKIIFATIVFPVGIYHLLHILAGKIIVQASILGAPFANNIRKGIQINRHTHWKYKRITIEVDGTKIDAMITGKKETLANGRWVLASNGNGELYEQKLLYYSQFQKLLEQLESI